MLVYILSALVAWVVWWLVGAAYDLWKKCVNVRGIPTLPDCHVIFGILTKIKDANDVFQLVLQYVEESRVRLFTIWCLHIVSVLPSHPSTIKQVLQASNVPKSSGTSGVYRMLKPWLGDGLLVSWGRKWERNRRLLTPAFHFDILKPYVDVYHNVTDIFLEKVSELTTGSSSVDICPLVSRATLDTMLRCTLSFNDHSVQSIQVSQQHPYVNAVHRLGYLVLNRVVNPFFHYDFTYNLSSKGREFRKLCDYVHDLSENIITSRKASIEADPSQLDKRHLDFLDILITARDEAGAGLTDHEIRDEVDTFLFEGHDTTASATMWALYSLAKYPDMQTRVRKEVTNLLDDSKKLKHDDLARLPYTTCFIKEVLRMYSPVPGMTRQLVEPLEIDGRTLAAGTIIELYPLLIHHHPDVWDNHKEFRPERFTPENSEGRDPFAFMPFSAGQRNCIGQNFAMNEIKVMITRFVTRFQIRVDPEREPEKYPEVVMRARNGIYLHFEDLSP